MTGDVNRQTIERYWDRYFRKDWKAVARFLAPDAHYTDVGVDPIGAHGPAEIRTRLINGIEPTSTYDHLPRHIIAQGNIVMTEHVEIWGFPDRRDVRTPLRVRHGTAQRLDRTIS